MYAKEIMTPHVITVTQDTRAQDIARLLVEHRISALPVVDRSGDVIGMVSEGDLLGRSEGERTERRDWWLTILAEGEALAPEFLATIQSPGRTAHELMSSPVLTVTATTEISEIAHLLTAYRLKRVPVVTNGHIVGIVSRADLVRAFAMQADSPMGSTQPRPREKHASEFLTGLDKHFHAHAHQPSATDEGDANIRAGHGETKLSVKDFQLLVEHFGYAKTMEQEKIHREAAEHHKRLVYDLIHHHIDEAGWQAVLHRAREAAQHGLKECLILRFPNDLCNDGGRAINVGEDGWPETLRGEAAEIYLRWRQDLRPQGFRLSARVLEFPGGFPGDIGLFLVWEP
jgi:CBS domain-containing protein